MRAGGRDPPQPGEWEGYDDDGEDDVWDLETEGVAEGVDADVVDGLVPEGGDGGAGEDGGEYLKRKAGQF